jgi:glycolate oxidase
MTDDAFLPGRWSNAPEVIAAHRTDRSGWRPDGTPLGVAFAETVADVQAVLRRANELRVPVVARGAGTGLSGAASATAGSVVLDLSRMNRILELSPVDQLAVVEPGVITADLDRAAARHGLRYAPDPASVEISTIGGNIATNAGGLRCAKYGVTRDAVLGLDVVLADGRLISTGRRTVKGVTGYDLTSLLVGSEGTLGVVVGATLRLRPVPAATATIAAFFDTFADAASAASAITAARLQPSVSELLDGATLAAIDAAQGSDLRSRGGAFLLVQADGAGAEVEAEAIEKVLSGRATSVSTTTDPEVAQRLLATRRQALPALERLGRVLIEDIAVPRSRMAEAVARIGGIAERFDVPIFTMAHAGDGNLHPILVVDPSRWSLSESAQPALVGLGDVPEPAWRAADEIFHLALSLGGTLTGEHGVGVLKRKWLTRELGEANHNLQRQLKSLFDPHGILNPGKAI